MSVDNTDFYLTLSPLEREYWQHFSELFKLVEAQKPEKGIVTLIVRARQHSENNNIPLSEALQQTLEGATERTLKRLALQKQCNLPAVFAKSPNNTII